MRPYILLLNLLVMGFLASRIASPEEVTQLFPPDYPKVRYQAAEFNFEARPRKHRSSRHRM